MKLPETEIHCPYQSEAWNQILALLPPDRELERWAREKGALRRRRGVKAAAVLLRVLLSYACCTLSLRGTSEWAQDSAWAKFNKSAVRKRLQQAHGWLQHLLEEVLSRPIEVPKVAGMRVLLADGTRLVPPGVRNRGWCAHTLLEPWSAQTVQVQLTDRKGGEHLRRFAFSAKDLVVTDAGFAHRRGLSAVANQDAFFLTRTNWCNLPFQTRHGRDFDLFKAIGPLEQGQTAEFEIQTRPDADNKLPALPIRLLVYRKPDEDAKVARRKVEKEARKKKRQVAPQTLAACHFVLLVTNVPKEKLDRDTLLELYRLRWQIELGFKRWKSLLNLDVFNVRQDESVRATLTAKLLGALLVERIVAGKGVGEAVWKYTRQVGEALRQAILGENAIRKTLDTTPVCASRQANREPLRQRERFQKLLANKGQSHEQQPLVA